MLFCLIILGVFSHAPGAVAASVETGRVSSVVRADIRTGHLVRKVVVRRPPAETSPSERAAVKSIVEDAAKQHDVDPLLVHSVIQVESNYDPLATSPKGAQGIMQLIPSTARRFGVTNSYDVRENIDGGVRYLRYLFDLFADPQLAVAAYNAGENAVIRHGGVPPYRETRDYVKRVGRKYGEAKKAASPSVARLEKPEKPSAPVYSPIEEYVDEQGRVHIRTR
ncbi:MAG: lytic transglycosylase domain-containing protein [Bryobacteraceae bacterium]